MRPEGGHEREEFNMSRTVIRSLLAFAAIAAITTPTDAQLLARKDLSLATALTIAQTAYETCTAQGYKVSVTVVGRTGEVLVQLRGDNAPPHTMENSFARPTRRARSASRRARWSSGSRTIRSSAPSI